MRSKLLPVYSVSFLKFGILGELLCESFNSRLATILRHLVVVGIETALNSTLLAAAPDVEIHPKEAAHCVQVPADGHNQKDRSN